MWRSWEELGGDVEELGGDAEKFRGVGKVWVSLHSRYGRPCVYRLWILPS